MKKVIAMEKYKLTKEYVKKQCCMNFLFSEWFNIHIFVLNMVVLIVWLRIMAEKEFFENIVAYLILVFFAVVTIVYAAHLLSSSVNLIRVMRGKFHICSDELVKRKPRKYYSRRNRYHARDEFGAKEGTYRLCFKTYGVYELYSTITPFEKGIVSPKKQYDEAYLGDIYYVAVVRGEIVGAYNSKYYYIEE